MVTNLNMDGLWQNYLLYMVTIFGNLNKKWKGMYILKGKIISISIGKPKAYQWKGKEEQSGIGKVKVDEAVLTKESFNGDSVANEKFHGGPDRAVCVYPFEHYDYWEKLFKKSFQNPAFGENISVKGMMEKDVYIGDIFQAGSAIIQITQGRIPCSTLSKYNDTDDLLLKTFETGYTGYFLRVLEEGTINVDEPMVLLERKQNNISVLEANLTMFRRKDPEKMKQLLAIEELAEEWKIKLEKYLKAVR